MGGRIAKLIGTLVPFISRISRVHILSETPSRTRLLGHKSREGVSPDAKPIGPRMSGVDQ
jgi:hypothetical protein